MPTLVLVERVSEPLMPSYASPMAGDVIHLVAGVRGWEVWLVRRDSMIPQELVARFALVSEPDGALLVVGDDWSARAEPVAGDERELRGLVRGYR